MLTPLRVLFVEDVEDDVLLITRILKKGGYDPDALRVDTAQAMHEALREKPWDVILCDYTLPGFSAPDAIAILLETNLDIPLIIVSGNIGEEAAVECMRLGARDYIRKENLPLLIPAITRELAETKTRNSLREAELEWQKSWENYRLLAEATSDFILTTDQNFFITFANTSLRNLMGTLEPVGLNIVDLTPPKLLDLHLQMKKRRQEGYRETLSYEWETLDPQGNPLILDVTSLPLNKDGEFAGVLFSARDITSRKRTEEDTKRLVERFNLATHAANLGVWDRDLQTNELLWNDRMYELYGVKKEEFPVSYDVWTRRIHPDDIDHVREEIQKTLDGKKDLNTAFRTVHPDGATKTIHTYGKVSRDHTGKPLRMTGINYDITERKQAENKLRESEFQYRSLFTEIREGFALHEIICDDSGTPVDYRFLNINPAFEKITGLTAAHVIGKSVRQVLPQTESHWIETYGKVAQTGEPVSFENYAKDFDRYYQVNAFCPQKGQFAVLFTDITERKKMEAQLIQAQKMEAIGTLAGGIAHDFNNILGAIIGYAGMAQDELPEDSPTLECIDEIFRASERAKKLVEQILAFSRRHDAERKPLLIVPLVKEIIKLLRPMLSATIRIKEEFHVEDASILADATQMHQVLMNLCTNATHAMQQKGGVITIGLSRIAVREDYHSRYDTLSAGNYLELKVADTGHGIDEKIQNLIFDPFFTTKKTGEGTGMGLSVVHGIVKSYGGHIRLESKAGKGTAFFIYLPLLDNPDIPDHQGKALKTVGGKERILLVDDQEMMLNMMTRALSRLGYRVTAKECSPAALELFNADPSAFDLVITDQTMPDLTGIDLAAGLLQVRPDIPIILCTGHSSLVSSEQARLAGIREYVMKPVVMSDFTRLIRKTLDDGQ